jgi:hypothetical protein
MNEKTGTEYLRTVDNRKRCNAILWELQEKDVKEMFQVMMAENFPD